MLQQKILQMPKCYQCSSINENNLKRLFRKFAWKFIEYPFDTKKLLLVLKEYSFIVTTSFLWHKSEYINEKAYFQNFSWFHIYAWLCCVPLLHSLLCWLVLFWHKFMWKLLSFHSENVSLIPLGKCPSYRRTINRWKKIQILKNLRAPAMWNHWVCF